MSSGSSQIDDPLLFDALECALEGQCANDADPKGAGLAAGGRMILFAKMLPVWRLHRVEGKNADSLGKLNRVIASSCRAIILRCDGVQPSLLGLWKRVLSACCFVLCVWHFWPPPM